MSAEKKNGIFAALYCNRVTVTREGSTIVNLSLVFFIIAVLVAPWLVLGGAIAALALGYKFGFVRNAAGFCGNFDQVVSAAKANVRGVVDSVTDHGTQA